MTMYTETASSLSEAVSWLPKRLSSLRAYNKLAVLTSEKLQERLQKNTT